MDNEHRNDLPEQDWDALLNTPAEEPAMSEADLEAQKWLDALLASTAPGPAPEPEPPAEAPAPTDDWFGQLEAPAETAQEIGTDEHAVASHEMTDMADMELEKIMQETMSDDWELPSFENVLFSDPIGEGFPEENDGNVGAAQQADMYTDEGVNPETETDPKRKVRPKRKNGYGLFGLPHLASTAIWAVLCIAIGISLGRLIWVCAADVLAFGRPDRDVAITIEATDDVDSVAELLYNNGLIKYRDLFKLYCQLAGAEVGGKISVGTFTLNTLYDYHALVGGMSATSSYRQTIDVVIPEGSTCAQIFAKLEENGVCTAAELEQYCIDNEFASYWFLEDVPKGTKYCLEGFLFPDTYNFYTNSTAREVFIKLLSGFENHFTEEMVAQLDVLNETLAAKLRANGLSEEYIEAHRFTVRDVVTVASMVEKETSFSGESPSIASVIYNRLTNPGNYPKLNIDATVVYALGGKTDLTAEDLLFDSPYNTYLYDGLPPGAISNPGSYSLRAALEPADTQYYFYALDPTAEVRSHRFFKTYKEHQDFLNSLG